jgi:hypothetical protein
MVCEILVSRCDPNDENGDGEEKENCGRTVNNLFAFLILKKK